RNRSQESSFTQTRDSQLHSSSFITDKNRRSKYVYSPSKRKGFNQKVSFNDLNSHSFHSVPSKKDLEGLNDAFTGESLNIKLGLHQCQNCKVYYHTESLQVINSENSGKCVACLSKNIIDVVTGQTYKSGRNYDAEVVTLQNYRKHIGHVITFEGHVPRINISRDGRSYAVMFENKSWKYGLKMIVFRGNVNKVGGKKFINNLKGKRIKIRGLLTCHQTFGYQIIISERSMVLNIQ
ncbi:MAG: hypothetical protein KDD29_10425, partial [Flavobacteriales bacterium]|nr:hypothetical protein [Flavobacteriales bacterium]